MALTFKEVSEIMKIIDASDCEEVELELESIRLVVRRGGSGGATSTAPVITSTPVGGAPRQEASAAVADAPTGPVATAAPQAAAASGTEIRAPMVGSFYRRSAPDQPPFVEVGARVKVGDPLCLIEVMKLYTTIEATAAGVVKQIAVEDTQLVEFDQLLFVIAAE